jgi:hypothetical protein
MSEQPSAVTGQPPARPTPGPWEVRLSPALVKTRCIVHETRNGTRLLSRHVATVSVHGPDAENEANARLLAAAPELLAACKRAVEWLDNGPGGTGMDAACAHVRAAIAKAEGRGAA